MGWFTSWFTGDGAELHALWLAGVGTTAAAFLALIAFLIDLRGRRKRSKQERRAQARRVWFHMGVVSNAFSTQTGQHVNCDPIRVANDSDEVVSWVNIDIRPIYQAKDGTVTRIPFEHTDESLTNQGVSMIGPGGYWMTEVVSIEVPNLGLDGMWLWDSGITFEDAAGVRWERRGAGQRLEEKPKTRAERREEMRLIP
jgi:hypothetical protein